MNINNMLISIDNELKYMLKHVNKYNNYRHIIHYNNLDYIITINDDYYKSNNIIVFIKCYDVKLSIKNFILRYDFNMFSADGTLVINEDRKNIQDLKITLNIIKAENKHIHNNFIKFVKENINEWFN